VLAPPYHPYTKMLLASASDDEAAEPTGSVMSVAAQAGCVFAMRCPHKLGPVCATTPPPLKALTASHTVACHLDTLPGVAPLLTLARSQPQPVAI